MNEIESLKAELAAAKAEAEALRKELADRPSVGMVQILKQTIKAEHDEAEALREDAFSAATTGMAFMISHFGLFDKFSEYQKEKWRELSKIARKLKPAIDAARTGG